MSRSYRKKRAKIRRARRWLSRQRKLFRRCESLPYSDAFINHLHGDVARAIAYGLAFVHHLQRGMRQKQNLAGGKIYNGNGKIVLASIRLDHWVIECPVWIRFPPPELVRAATMRYVQNAKMRMKNARRIIQRALHELVDQQLATAV